MNEILLILDQNIGFISLFIFVWFAYDCYERKRFIVDKVEWSLYAIFATCSTCFFWVAGLGVLINV